MKLTLISILALLLSCNDNSSLSEGGSLKSSGAKTDKKIVPKCGRLSMFNESILQYTLEIDDIHGLLKDYFNPKFLDKHSISSITTSKSEGENIVNYKYKIDFDSENHISKITSYTSSMDVSLADFKDTIEIQYYRSSDIDSIISTNLSQNRVISRYIRLDSLNAVFTEYFKDGWTERVTQVKFGNINEASYRLDFIKASTWNMNITTQDQSLDMDIENVRNHVKSVLKDYFVNMDWGNIRIKTLDSIGRALRYKVFDFTDTMMDLKVSRNTCGNITEVIDNKNTHLNLEFNYDSDGKLVQENYGSFSTFFEYNNDLRTKEITGFSKEKANKVITYAYEF